MSETHFEPALALKVDFDQGQVQLRGQGPCLVVPKGALLDLLQAAGSDATNNFGQQLGTELGRRMRDHLGTAIESARVETIVEHLGGELALLGLGALTIERWGQALVMVIEGGPAGKTGAQLVSMVISAAIQRAWSRDVSVVELVRTDHSVRLLVVSRGAADTVRQWLSEELPWGTVLTRLHAEKGGAA